MKGSSQYKKHKASSHKPLENYAFIDGQNLYKGVSELDWELDYYRFRHYLRAKFGVKEAFIFLGYIAENQNLYDYLEHCGFTLIFKEVAKDSRNKAKGNVDVDLTLNVMKKLKEFKKAVLVTSDGDFAPLVKELKERNQFRVLISPTRRKTSYLLRKAVGIQHVPLSKIKTKVETKTKRHTADR